MFAVAAPEQARLMRRCTGATTPIDLGDVGAVAAVGGGRAVDPGGVVARAGPGAVGAGAVRRRDDRVAAPAPRLARDERVAQRHERARASSSACAGPRARRRAARARPRRSRPPSSGPCGPSASPRSAHREGVHRTRRCKPSCSATPSPWHGWSAQTRGKGPPTHDPPSSPRARRHDRRRRRAHRPRRRPGGQAARHHRERDEGRVLLRAPDRLGRRARQERPSSSSSTGARSPTATQTAEAPAGRATGRTRVGADVLGLEPTRLYHYRLVARNRDGTTLGQDRTFRAKKQPLGFLVTATPNPVPFGDDFAVTGALGGTGAGGRAVALQGRGFPYTGPWTPLGNAQVTAPERRLLVLGAQRRRQHPVPRRHDEQPGRGERRRAGRRRRPRRDPRQPPARAPRRPRALLGDDHAREGRRAVRRSSAWTAGASGSRWPAASRAAGARASSRFSKRYRVRRTNRYRIFVSVADGTNQSAAGRTVRIRARR